MPVVDPDPKRLPDILKSIPADTPIVMLNLRPTAATHWWRSRRSKASAVRCSGPATPWPA